MPKTSPIAELLVSVVTLALVVAACGGGTSGDTAPEATSPMGSPVEGGSEDRRTINDASGGPTTETSDVEAEDELATFAELLGYDLDDPDAARARAAADHRRFEESVARCMAEQGFEYVPAIRPARTSGVALDEGEFARERGFGITTWYGQEDQSGPDEDEWVNPNEGIVAAMSESERDSYHDALYGSYDEQATDPGTGEQIFYESSGGCSDQANDEVYGFRDQVWETLGPAHDEVFQRVLADPRFQEAEQAWSACMADRGYAYDGVKQMAEHVNEDFERRLAEITGPADGFINPFKELTEEETGALSEDERNDLIEQAEDEVLANMDQEALAALQQEERDLATANFECGQDLTERTEELQREYEGQFIRENPDLLDELSR